MSKTNRQLTPQEVRRIAGLAKLPLTETEIHKFQKQLASIFDYIDLIGEMETAKVAETSQTTGSDNVFREDRIDLTQVLPQAEALRTTPASYQGYFKVKAVLESE